MSNSLRMKCPGCQATLQMKEEMRGKQVACPKCQTRMRIPAVAAQSDAMPAMPLAAPEPKPASIWDDENLLPSATSAQFPPSADGNSSPPVATSNYYQNLKFENVAKSKSPAKRTERQTQIEEYREDGELTDADANIQSTGIYLVVVPILAAILPLFGLQLRRLARSGEYAPLGAMILGFIGAGLIVYARRNRSDAPVAGIIAGAVTLVFGVGGFLLQSSDQLVAHPWATQEILREQQIPTAEYIAQKKELQRQQIEALRKTTEEQERSAHPIHGELDQRQNNFQPKVSESVAHNDSSKTLAKPNFSPPPSGFGRDPSFEMPEMRNIRPEFPTSPFSDLLMQDPSVMFQLMQTYQKGTAKFAMLGNGGKKLIGKNPVGSEGPFSQLYTDSPVTGICGMAIGTELAIVPISPQDSDVKFAIKPSDDQELHGLRFAFDQGAIVGFQGLLRSRTTSEVEETEWYGKETKDVRESMNPKPGRSGIVCYKNIKGFCGFAWVDR